MNKNEYIWAVDDIPIFQNVVLNTFEEAIQFPKVNVILKQDEKSGLVINSNFNENIIYNKQYDNDQTFSDSFKKHLTIIKKMLIDRGFYSKRIVEIGAGKGYFLEYLENNGFNIIGYDPAYNGNNPKIFKEYFSDGRLEADLIILRHTLEHIPNPHNFIKNICKQNNYKGKIFIEVPDFNWIVRKKAFWDIFHEHCNYFTKETLSNIFNNCEIASFFNEQYIYLFANIKDIKSTLNEEVIRYDNLFQIFNSKMNYYKKLLEENNNIVLWGAASKGVTFVNLLDKKRQRIKYLVDINPNKQNKYIPGTGHTIFSPDYLFEDKTPTDMIIVMNKNYFNEIKIFTKKLNIKLISL